MLRGPALSVPLVVLLLAAGCGGDGEEQAAAPAPAATTTAPAAAPQEAPATTQPATTEPAEKPQATEKQAEPAEKAEAPKEEKAPEQAAPAQGAGDADLSGAADAAAANLRAQVEGDYAALKRLVTKRCAKEISKASVEQMATAFQAMSKQSGQAELAAMLDQLTRPEGWKVQAAGDGKAKVTADEKFGITALHYVREGGTWRDDTCAQQASGGA